MNGTMRHDARASRPPRAAPCRAARSPNRAGACDGPVQGVEKPRCRVASVSGLSVVALSMRGLFDVAGWAALVVVPAMSLLCLAVLVRQPASIRAARRRHTDALVGVRYGARNGSHFEFDFEFWPGEGWQAFILRQPDYSGGVFEPAAHPEETRRTGVGDRTRIAWADQPPPTYQDLLARAARWAESTSRYAQGENFQPGLLASRGSYLWATEPDMAALPEM